MKGLWLENGAMSYRDDIEPPPPGEGEVRLDVGLAGICGTDMELLSGYAGLEGVPGHEFVATVADGPPDWIGDRVVAEINVSCGQCRLCALGLSKHCEARSVVGIRRRFGAFAGTVSVPLSNCYRVPQSLPDQQAVLVEPLAAALEILESNVLDDKRVLIVGAGRLAVLIAQVVRSRTAAVEVLVRRAVRRAAFEPAGITCIETPGSGYDVVVEVSGSPDGFTTALDAVRPRGTLVMKSTYARELTLDASRIVVDEIRIAGSRCGPFAEAIEWLATGRIKLDHLAFERFALANYERAFERARDPSVYKVLLAPD